MCQTTAEQRITVRRSGETTEITDPAGWVDDHGDALLRFALMRVGRRDVAEDMVQDTFLAAWSSRDSFDGRSAIRTWLTGILRRKIADYYRRAGRLPPQQAAGSDSDDAGSEFNEAGKWEVAPRRWPVSPDRVVEDAEFRQVLARCIAELPAHLAQAFELREMKVLPVPDVCRLAEISPKNLSVRLHRARLLLRRCLERNWYCPHDARR